MSPIRSIVTVFAIGAVAGGVFFVSFMQLLNVILARSIDGGVNFIVGLLMAAASVYIVLLITMVLANVTGYIALRMFGLPRAFQTSLFSTVLLTVTWALLIKSGRAPTGRLIWLCLIMFGIAYGSTHLLLPRRRSSD